MQDKAWTAGVYRASFLEQLLRVLEGRQDNEIPLKYTQVDHIP